MRGQLGVKCAQPAEGNGVHGPRLERNPTPRVQPPGSRCARRRSVHFMSRQFGTTENSSMNSSMSTRRSTSVVAFLVCSTSRVASMRTTAPKCCGHRPNAPPRRVHRPHHSVPHGRPRTHHRFSTRTPTGELRVMCPKTSWATLRIMYVPFGRVVVSQLPSHPK
jgi:hypothetical protein